MLENSAKSLRHRICQIQQLECAQHSSTSNVSGGIRPLEANLLPVLAYLLALVSKHENLENSLKYYLMLRNSCVVLDLS